MELLKIFLEPTVILLGLIIGLYQYSKQQKFKRLQNLSSLWKSFGSDVELLSLFDIMNELENGETRFSEDLKNYDTKVKLKYLALIEEVALYVDAFEVDTAYASYLFQWHLYYVYQSKITSESFWANLGGDKEMNASYWQKSRDFSKKCLPA